MLCHTIYNLNEKYGQNSIASTVMLSIAENAMKW